MIKELFSKQFNYNLDDITISKVYGFDSINNYLPMPIEISNSYDKNNLITINDNVANQLGEIYFLKGRTVNINSLPESQYTAFLIELNESILSTPEYTFKYDYLILNTSYAGEYFTKYKQSSMVWGGFLHLESSSGHYDFNEYSSVSRIVVKENIDIASDNFKEILVQIVHVSKTLVIGPPKTEYVGPVKTEYPGPKRCS